MRPERRVLLAALGLSFWVGGAWAHHSTASYDYTRSVTIEGTVRSFQWSNPHSYIQLLVPVSGGPSQEWSIEAGVPGGMTRMGWTPTSLRPGDKIKLLISPMKNGSHAGTVRSVTLPNGKTLMGAAAATTFNNAPTPADLLPSLKRVPQ